MPLTSRQFRVALLPYLVSFVLACLAVFPNHASATQIFLTSDSTWSVPLDWNSSNNTIEVIGGGGSGGVANNYWVCSSLSTGGGGGAYSKISNVLLTPGSSVPYIIGLGGPAASPPGWVGPSNGNDGGDTWFNDTAYPTSGPNKVGAKGGLGGSALYASVADTNGGAGGDASQGYPSSATRYSGGRGGSISNATPNYGCAGGLGVFATGGGGAAGKSGNGVNGGDITSGLAGSTPGGIGDAGYGGVGGFVSGSIGGNGSEWNASYGSGGGGPSSGSTIYGGGGGQYGAGGGSQSTSATAISGSGAPGLIVITYTPVVSPTCTITADVNPLAYGNTTTLHWTSANSDTFFITNVGYVTPNQSGSATIGPLSTTAFNGTATGPGGTTNCNFTENVLPQPPQNLTGSCNAAGTTGTINWTTGSGATSHYVRVDDQANPWAPARCDGIPNDANTGDICTPPITGVPPYTFSSTPNHIYDVWVHSANTAGLSSASSATINCTPTPPTVSASLTPTSIVRGDMAALSWTSTVTTTSSCNIPGIGVEGVFGSVVFSPLQTTTYTVTCTGPGGSASSNATLTVTCTPSSTYSCSGNTIVQTTTSAQCAVTTNASYATCTAPSYCSNGLSSCVTPIPTGSLTASPKIVNRGGKTRITWSTTGTAVCTVSGNGDSWSGTSGAATSSIIAVPTTYILSCDSGAYTQSVSITLVPGWKEF